jgi:hypothetical protein
MAAFMGGFKDGRQVIVPVPLEFTDILTAFITHKLVRIHQKKKIAVECVDIHTAIYLADFSKAIEKYLLIN